VIPIVMTKMGARSAFGTRRAAIHRFMDNTDVFVKAVQTAFGDTGLQPVHKGLFPHSGRGFYVKRKLGRAAADTL